MPDGRMRKNTDGSSIILDDKVGQDKSGGMMKKLVTKIFGDQKKIEINTDIMNFKKTRKELDCYKKRVSILEERNGVLENIIYFDFAKQLNIYEEIVNKNSFWEEIDVKLVENLIGCVSSQMKMVEKFLENSKGFLLAGQTYYKGKLRNKQFASLKNLKDEEISEKLIGNTKALLGKPLLVFIGNQNLPNDSLLDNKSNEYIRDKLRLFGPKLNEKINISVSDKKSQKWPILHNHDSKKKMVKLDKRYYTNNLNTNGDYSLPRLITPNTFFPGNS